MSGVAPTGHAGCVAWLQESMPEARLAQSAERKALNLVVVGSSPTVGALMLPASYVVRVTAQLILRRA